MARSELTLEERDRRWNGVRKLLRDRKLDALLAFGLKGREQVDRWLTNDRSGSIVLFPADGEPVQLVWTAYMALSHLVSSERGEGSWVNDLRAGLTGVDVVTLLREQGLAEARLGMIGIHTHGPGEPEGWVPYTTWTHVQAELPRATFEEVSDEILALMLVKSEEEIAVTRWAAEIGERACEAMLKTVAPGVSEADVYAAAMAEIIRHGAQGCVSPYLTPMILHSGPDNPSWGPPAWMVRAQEPRRLERGDVVAAELFPTYGGIESQQQMAIAISPVSPVVEECAEIARASYEAGVKALGPGVTFGSVVDAMERVLTEARAWHLTPLIHTLAPLWWVSGTGVGLFENIPEMRRYGNIRPTPVRGADRVVTAGMTFELEPNACKGRVRVNIGGTVVVTEHGVVELNQIPTRLRVV